jgi:hypothetical protein
VEEPQEDADGREAQKVALPQIFIVTTFTGKSQWDQNLYKFHFEYSKLYFQNSVYSEQHTFNFRNFFLIVLSIDFKNALSPILNHYDFKRYCKTFYNVPQTTDAR